jgi:hypothetical protein
MHKLNAYRVVPLVVLGILVLMAINLTFAADTEDQGGHVLPASAKPYGYSLDDMAQAMALFQTSGEVSYYPTTPFQILFTGPNSTSSTSNVVCADRGQGTLFVAENTFPVTVGVTFFVPLFQVDDSPPVLGVFPTQKSQAADYFFGPTQFGGRDTEIIVDGRSTAVGADFLGGPITQINPALLDGGGTHFMQLGVFLTPLSVGSHTVEIKGELGNSALFYNTLSQYYGSCLREDITYKVNVLPRLEAE